MLARPVYSACFGQSQHAAFKLAFRNAANAKAPGVRRGVASSARASFKQQQSRTSPTVLLLAVAGGSSLALFGKPIRCDVTSSAGRPYAEPHTVSVQGPGSGRLTRANEPPAVESSVDLRSLSFGAVAGVSTGLFVKKGLKAAGFLLGGVFVLLQVRNMESSAGCADMLGSTSEVVGWQQSTGRQWPIPTRLQWTGSLGLELEAGCSVSEAG
jgi:hypothetical protein